MNSHKGYVSIALKEPKETEGEERREREVVKVVKIVKGVIGVGLGKFRVTEARHTPSKA